MPAAAGPSLSSFLFNALRTRRGLRAWAILLILAGAFGVRSSSWADVVVVEHRLVGGVVFIVSAEGKLRLLLSMGKVSTPGLSFKSEDLFELQRGWYCKPGLCGWESGSGFVDCWCSYVPGLFALSGALLVRLYRLRRWQVTHPDELACPTCGYLLLANQSRCPECGQAVPPPTADQKHPAHRA